MSETHAPQARSTYRLVAYGGIALLFLGLHLAHIAQVLNAPPGQIPIIDSKYYLEWAQRLLNGLGLGPQPFFMSPLYPLLMAFSAHLGFGVVPSTFTLQTLLSLGTLLLIGRYAARRFTPWAGPAAALLYCLYDPALYYDATLLSATLILFLTMVALTLLDREEGLPWWRVAAAGLAIGLSALARPNALLLLIAFSLVFLLRDFRRGWRNAALLMLAAALVLLPVMLRNARNGGGFTLTTNSLGVNLFIGNGPYSSGIYTEAPWLTSAEPIYEAEDYRLEAQHRTGKEMTASGASRYWSGQAVSWAAHHPWAWIKLEGKKFFFFFNKIEIANNVSMYGVAEYSRMLHLLQFFSFGLIAPLGLIGLALALRRRSTQFALALLLSYLAANLAFFVSSEYRFPIVGVLVVFSVGAVVELVRRVRAADYVSAVQTATLFLLLVLLVNAPWKLLKAEADPAMDYFNWASVSYGKDDLTNASLLFSAALARRPEWNEAHLQLAFVFEDMGMKSLADKEFNAAGVNPADVNKYRLQERARKQVLPEDLRGDPSEMNAAQLTALATRFNQIGRPRDALPVLQRSLEKDTTIAATWFQYGITLQSLRYYGPSIQALYKAQKLNPDDPLIPYRIAWAYFTSGDAGMARSTLRLVEKKVHEISDKEIREKWFEQIEKSRNAFENY